MTTKLEVTQLRNSLITLRTSCAELCELLDRINRAHKSDNNGAVMGEATLCAYFSRWADEAIANARKALA